MAAKKQGLMKDGTRRPTAQGGRGGGMPRIMWLAIVVCVVGAVFLFRSRSADIPAGIGENQTVVTAPDVESTLERTGEPHSGDVDIGEQAAALTPEKPVEEAAATAAESVPKQVAAETEAAKAEVPQAKKETTTAKVARPASKTPAPPPIVPMNSGPYVVQIGSFGEAANADKEATRLQQLGWGALVKMGNTSTGEIIHRVHIGYFKSRTDAEAFIAQNRKEMRGAIAIHR